MGRKAKPGRNRKRIVVIAVPEEEDHRLEKKDPGASKPASTSPTMQAIIRVAEESSFVHFYLACGHLVTVKKIDVSNRQIKEMECWACSTEKTQNVRRARMASLVNSLQLEYFLSKLSC